MPNEQPNEIIENVPSILQFMTNRYIIFLIVLVVSVLMIILVNQYFFRKAPIICKHENTVSVLPAACETGINFSQYHIVNEAEDIAREWKQGNTKVPLTEDAHACYLTMVTGRFEGGGEAVWVEKDREDDMWYLFGKSKQAGVAANARCIKLKIEPAIP